MRPEFFAGVDTSNYTTSAAVVSYDGGDLILTADKRQLLPVREGERGIRQNEAVFRHVTALPELFGSALSGFEGRLGALAYSDRPCSVEGSYMPCFRVGEAVARAASDSLRVPCRAFAHQQGHIAAVLFGAGRLDLLRERFIAFHVSGGTTEAVVCEPGSTVFTASPLFSSLDLKAGQLIDRVGVAMGLPFPAGKAIDELARSGELTRPVRVNLRDGCPSISGAENICLDMLSCGESQQNVARFCIEFVCACVRAMTEAALDKYPGVPVVYSGGVMSNSIISQTLSRTFDGIFSPPFATDNAVGIAVLGCLAETER